MYPTTKASNKRFTTAETQTLIDLVRKHLDIVESKKNDGFTNKIKDIAWSKIATAFNASGVGENRNAKALKQKYESLKKLSRKKNLQKYQNNKSGEEALKDYDEVQEVYNYDSSSLDSHCNSDSTTQDSQKKKGKEYSLESAEFSNQNGIMEINNSDGNSQAENDSALVVSKLENASSKTLKKYSKSVIKSKSDKLAVTRLELVKLQKQLVLEEFRLKEAEHELRMEHLRNEEMRKQQIHNLTVAKLI